MNSLLRHLFGELSGQSNLRGRFSICLLNSKFMNTHELNKWPRLSPPLNHIRIVDVRNYYKTQHFM